MVFYGYFEGHLAVEFFIISFGSVESIRVIILFRIHFYINYFHNSQ